MKMFSLLVILISVRTCTKESVTFEQKAAQVGSTPKVEAVVTSTNYQHDTAIVSGVGMYYDDIATRGLKSDERSKLTQSATFAPEFYQRFTYPEVARSRVEGSCTVQFAIDASSKIHYFSVLHTDSKVFSDEVRKAITSKPVTFISFPRLPGESQAVRVEVTVNYRLKTSGKM